MPVTVSAPEGCILNALRARPGWRTSCDSGRCCPDLVFGCLAQALPERVPAEGASSMWNISVRGRFREGERASQAYSIAVTTSGGTGARFKRDGLSATAFPTGIHCIPVEIAETQVPIVFWRKELRTDSAGAGRTRGGLGKINELESTENAPFRLSAAFERIQHPARGRLGGAAGSPGYAGLASGAVLRGKGLQEIPAESGWFFIPRAEAASGPYPNVPLTSWRSTSWRNVFRPPRHEQCTACRPWVDPLNHQPS